MFFGVIWIIDLLAFELQNNKGLSLSWLLVVVFAMSTLLPKTVLLLDISPHWCCWLMIWSDVCCGKVRGELSSTYVWLTWKLLECDSPMFEGWDVPKREIGGPYGYQHLVAHRTAEEIRTNSSGMRTHTGQHWRLPCMHTFNLLWLTTSRSCM